MPYELPVPPKKQPYSYGLIQTFGTESFPYRIAEDGATWIEESCEFPKEIAYQCDPALKPAPVRQIRGVKDPASLPREIYTALECSTPTNSQSQANEATLEVHRRGLPLFLSNRFLRDELEANSFLVPQPGTYTPSCALALSQDDVNGDDGLGRKATIFAAPAIVSIWTEGHAVFERGGKLWTSLGSQVVSVPQQFIGAAPPYYVYASDSEPVVYLSEEHILSDDSAAMLRREINSYIGVVEQEYLFQFDPCILRRYEVELCV